MPRITPKTLLGIALLFFIIISIFLYTKVESRSGKQEAIYSQSEHEISIIKEKLSRMGNELKTNEEEMDKLQNQLEEAKKELNDKNILESPLGVGGGKVKVVHDVLADNSIKKDFKEVVGVVNNEGICPLMNYNPKSEIQMLDAYEEIPFDNPDGGVWKQGWEITYDKDEILKEKKLEVIVVPHSHNDPGWLKTFEGYYQSSVLHILNGMLKNLKLHDDLKFIYAEMSFFELWWSNLNDEERRTVKGFLDKGQLEIVTGGWVMTDEANSHYFATIMEIFEGHEFLINQLDYKPTSHWSIDPFGLSPITTYVVKSSNLTHAAVQRVHYSVKKYLAKAKNLEFKWRQLWAGNKDKTDIFTHMFPFYSYDVPHTCGPNPKVCCQFDFKRLWTAFCPWGISPQKITPNNIVERATLLADQYRKKAQLYKTNVVFIPLGDDFRYDEDKEWKEQYENYIKLFKQMNSDTTLNIHARFGTLKDYFNLLEKRITENDDNTFNVLSGDFFTYADRDDHYWSGYYTSRPFYKHMDRTLQSYIRSADIIFTLANWKSQTIDKKWSGIELYDRLVDARRALSIFQHHDGVTGTARDDVVIDYGEKMLAAINWAKQIISSATEYLLKFPQMREQGIKITEEHFVDQLPKKFIIDDGATVVVFNPLEYTRNEVVCIHVNSQKSKISLSNNEQEEILQQIAPILRRQPNSNQFTIEKDKYELCFLSKLPPFGIIRYSIFEAQNSAENVVEIQSSTTIESADFDVNRFNNEKLILKNEKVTAEFNSKTGFLKQIILNNEEPMPVEMNFVKYGVRSKSHKYPGGEEQSGAYLFLPDGEAKDLSNSENTFVVIDGPVRKTIYICGNKQMLLTQAVSLDVDTTNLYIKNEVDIRNTNNFELAMRLKTGIIDGENFYTDLNGYQMIKRKRFSKLPLQAQFYPMPSSAFIENNSKRITVIGRQANGVASLNPGWLEIMLDRRLDQDDNRGLAQPVHDNLKTESSFYLLLENMNGEQQNDAKIGYHSLISNIVLNELHYPSLILYGHLDHAASDETLTEYIGLKQELPCDLHFVTLRTLSLPTVYGDSGTRSTTPQNSAALIMHRYGTECRSKSIVNRQCNYVQNDSIALKPLFNDPLKNARNASLTLLYSDNEKDVNDVVITPMELKTIKLNF